MGKQRALVLNISHGAYPGNGNLSNATATSFAGGDEYWRPHRIGSECRRKIRQTAELGEEIGKARQGIAFSLERRPYFDFHRNSSDWADRAAPLFHFKPTRPCADMLPLTTRECTCSTHRTR